MSKDSESAEKAIRSAEEILRACSFNVHSDERVRCNVVLIDHRILWYGSLAPLGFHKEDDSILRIESPRLAEEMQSVLEAPLHQSLDDSGANRSSRASESSMEE